jgi:predicted  nucleic acid-binding Zn-ribbon protein
MYVPPAWRCWVCGLALWLWDSAAAAMRDGCPRCNKNKNKTKSDKPQ